MELLLLCLAAGLQYSAASCSSSVMYNMMLKLTALSSAVLLGDFSVTGRSLALRYVPRKHRRKLKGHTHDHEDRYVGQREL